MSLKTCLQKLEPSSTRRNKATCNTPGCLRHLWYECSHEIPILQTECGVPAYQTVRPTPSKQDGARRVRDSEIGILHPVLSPRDPYVHVLYIHICVYIYTYVYIYTHYMCVQCDVPLLGFYPLHYLSLCIPIKEPALRAHAFFPRYNMARYITKDSMVCRLLWKTLGQLSRTVPLVTSRTS